MFPNTKIDGGDPEGDKTIAECRQACLDDDDCRAFDYEADGSPDKCFLVTDDNVDLRDSEPDNDVDHFQKIEGKLRFKNKQILCQYL